MRRGRHGPPQRRGSALAYQAFPIEQLIGFRVDIAAGAYHRRMDLQHIGDEPFTFGPGPGEGVRQRG